MSIIPFQTILCPIDFSEDSEKSLTYASTMAELHKSKIFVIHVIPHVTPLSRTAYYDGDENEGLKELCEKFIPKDVPHEFQLIKNDEVSEGICNYAEEKKADIVVMGSHGHSKLGTLLLGSVVTEVTRKAPCPVLVVRRLKHEQCNL